MALFVSELWSTTCELAPWLLLGAAIAGLIHALLPAGFLERQLRGRMGVAKAVALGVPLPLCSCGVVPLGLSLKQQGAGVGAAVGFLIATPQTGIDSLLVTGPILGWPFALFKVVVALVTGMVGGWLADRAEPPALPSLSVLPPAKAAKMGAWWREAWSHADEVLASIWKWLAVGLLIAAALSVWLPTVALEGVLGQGIVVALAVTLLASIPLYVCATASVPIAAALASAGLPMAAVMVFLMAGPATNAATIGALYRGLGRRATAIYLATIVVGSIAGGLAFDALSPAFGDTAGTQDWGTSAAAEHVHVDHEPGLLAVVAATVLIAWVARFVWRDARKWLRKWPGKRHRRVPAGEPTETLGVDGLRCGACVEKLETALNADPQIHAARVQLVPGVVEVTGAASRERVAQIVSDAGFVARL